MKVAFPAFSLVVLSVVPLSLFFYCAEAQSAGSGSLSGSGGSPDIPVSWKTYVFGLVVALVFVALVASIAPVFSILCSAAVLLYLLGIIDETALFSGLVNNGVLSIAMLYVIVHPVVELPLMKTLVQKLLGTMAASVCGVATIDKRPWVLRSGANALTPEMLRLGRWARFKLCLVSMLVSPFLENTPQTAMFTPLVAEHCRRVGLAPSQVLMPMVYAILLGNYFTLGFSSNLIVSGLMEKHSLGGLPLFELAKVNLPLLVPILVYLVFVPRYVLPLRRGGMTFCAKLKVTHTSPLVSKRVADIFCHFLASRTENTEKISVYRRSTSSNAVGRALSWEKIREPFSHVVVLRPGDEVVVGGLVATIDYSASVDSGATAAEEELLTTQTYTSPTAVLNSDVAVDIGDTAQASDQRVVSHRDEAIALSAAAASRGSQVSQSNQHAVGDIASLQIEKDLYRILVSSLDDTYRGGDGQAASTATPASVTSPTFSARSFGPNDKRSHQAHLRAMCKKLGVMMLALKVSMEGLDLLRDDVAYAKSPNLVTSTRLLAVPMDPSETPAGSRAPRDLSSDAASSPTTPRTRAASTLSTATIESEAQQALLDSTNRQREESMTWEAWHVAKGGRMFRVPLPMWFPLLGTPEAINDNSPASPPQSPTTDVMDPHSIVPITAAAVYEGHESSEKEKEPTWKVVRLPWWYEYMSVAVFLGVVIASFFDVKLDISCFVACCACVVLRLVSTKALVKALPVEIYLLVAFSFPLGSGMTDSGLASVMGRAMVDADVTGIRLLYLVGAITLVFTNMITSQGSVQVIFPLVLKVYEAQGLDPLPGIMMMLSCLSAALCTPFAIPSNAVILVPGGYTPLDYFKFGVPLSLVVLVLLGVTIAAIYGSW